VETLAVGDPNQALLFAGTITAFGGLVGAVAYAIAANRGLRRLGLAVAAALVVGAAAVAWTIFFTPFYAVELGDEQLRLLKVYPSRAVTLAKGDVAKVERRNEVTKNAYTVVLVVHSKDGRTFTSATTRPQQLAEQYARVQAWLAEP
jgi:hypothetical protein